jgi:hypothetical protein
MLQMSFYWPNNLRAEENTILLLVFLWTVLLLIFVWLSRSNLFSK